MDRIDEAVEVALSAESDALNGGNTNRYSMRAALLASLPVLLGEPVAWVEVGQACLGRVDEWKLRPKQLEPEDQPLYAPSLGEGDGR